jgi:hypothetical protein
MEKWVGKERAEELRKGKEEKKEELSPSAKRAAIFGKKKEDRGT